MAQRGRVLIVGGGIGGLAAAASLRKVGIAADVFEQAPQLREIGAGVGLWTNALASLDQIGVGDDIRRASVPLRIAAGARPDGRTLSSIKLDAHNSPPDNLVVAEKRKGFLLDRYRGWPFGLPEAIAATSADAILQNDLVDRPPAKRYVHGRVVLIGDAAHPTTPNLGQGANMAIDDAISLARALRDETTVSGALARYERERIPRTRLIVQRSWSFGSMCLWDSALGVAFRERLVQLTPRRVMTDMLRWQILEGVGTL